MLRRHGRDVRGISLCRIREAGGTQWTGEKMIDVGTVCWAESKAGSAGGHRSWMVRYGADKQIEKPFLIGSVTVACFISGLQHASVS